MNCLIVGSSMRVKTAGGDTTPQVGEPNEIIPTCKHCFRTAPPARKVYKKIFI